MQTLQAFLSRLNPLVPGCPQPAASQALVDSAIEFCQKSEAVRARLDPIMLQAGVVEYDLDLPQQQRAIRLVSASLADHPVVLEDNTSDQARRFWVRLGLASGSTVAFNHPPGDEQAGQPLECVVALGPLRVATTLADALYDDWAEAIVSGAVARLAAQPGLSYTSADLVTYHRGLFLAEVSRAKLERGLGRVVGERRVKGRTFAGRRC